MSNVDTTFMAQATPGVPWAVSGATVVSNLNEPYLVRIDIETERPDVEPLELLGSAAELRVVRGGGENAYAGIVSSVRSVHHHGAATRATLTLEPALAALRHGRDTKIFQAQTAPEVLASVLTEALAPYGREARSELSRTYPVREYTVQYEESVFDFVHRLMEEEGILYYFEQQGGVETLVMLDATQQHPVIPAGPLLEFASTEGDAGVQEREYVRSFEPISSVVGSAIATRHFDWTHPSAMIATAAEPAGPGELPDGAAVGPLRESYQHDEQLTLHSYAGAYQGQDANDQMRVRSDAQARDSMRFEARSTVTAIRAGLRFDLNGHPSLGLNASYVVTGVRIYVNGHAHQSGLMDDSAGAFVNRFTTVVADKPYRPRRVRPRPRIHGIQTAIVTGPPGEEIHCDEWGRIKVQFHWDRVGGYDERTSCWVRVMQTAAGSGFGAWVLPRVGWEVVVSFVDGDPDRPLVTGCVYNGDQPLPYPLPEKKAMTLFKSNSYPGGDGFNELRLDDSKGAEEIWLHGEKDWNTLIRHDLNRTVLNDETQEVVMNRTRIVGIDEGVQIGNDRNKKVLHDETYFVGNDRGRQVVNNESIQVGVDRTKTIGSNETVTIGQNATRTIGANRIENVIQNAATHVAMNLEETIGMNRALNVVLDSMTSVVGSATEKIGGSDTYEIGKDRNIKVGKDLGQRVKGSEKLDVAKTRTRTVGLMETVTIGAAQMINVTAARTVSVGGFQAISVGVDQKITVGGTQSTAVTGDDGTKVGGNYDLTVTGNYAVKVDGELSITCGGATIVISGDNIAIKGADITLDSSGQILTKSAAATAIKAGGDVAVNGATVLLNC